MRRNHGTLNGRLARVRTTVTAAPGTDRRLWQLTCPAVSAWNSSGSQSALTSSAPSEPCGPLVAAR
jgi:hypothetical protein